MERIDKQQHLTELIDLYQNLIFSICCKMTGDYFAAEDLTQETFLSAYRHIESFAGSNEKAYLCRIAANKCTDYLKSAARRQIPSEESAWAARPDAAAGPEASALEDEIYTTLLKRCSGLKPPYDKIAILYFCEEKNAEEIASKQNKNVKTVQTQR